MKFRILILILIVAKSICSQDTYFLDSLFLLDCSHINDVTYELQRSEAKRLESNWGVTAGVRISNSYQDEIDAGLSTRVFASMNVLSNGYYSNRVNAEIIKNEMSIDGLNGIERAADHNYGIYYDYIISEYNHKKISIIDSIISSSNKLKDYYSTLYYNKLIDYEKLLQVTSIVDQYHMLQQSQKAYNLIIDQIELDTILPAIPLDGMKVDFEGILQMVSLDTSSNQIAFHRNEILELKLEKDKVPSLSITGGYDISRKRPFYSVGFTTRITRNKNPHIVAQKEKIRNDIRLADIQKKKELINLQYEYQYKDKQIRGLYLKLDIIKEQKRKYRVKNDILSLQESAQEKKIELEKHMIEYEIYDLKQQQMLMLLRIKKVIWKLKIGPYLKASEPSSSSKKFIGKRYVLIQENSQMNKIDIHIMTQNEIKPLLPKELIELQNVILVDPAKYKTRAEMEEAIHALVQNMANSNIVIESIESLKKLELRTLEQKDFHLTAFNK